MEILSIFCCKSNSTIDTQFEVACLPKTPTRIVLEKTCAPLRRSKTKERTKNQGLKTARISCHQGDTIEASLDFDRSPPKGRPSRNLPEINATLTPVIKKKRKEENSQQKSIMFIRTPRRKFAKIAPSASSSFVFTPTVFHPEVASAFKLDVLLVQASICFKKSPKSCKSIHTCYETPTTSEKNEDFYDSDSKKHTGFEFTHTPYRNYKGWQV